MSSFKKYETLGQFFELLYDEFDKLKYMDFISHQFILPFQKGLLQAFLIHGPYSSMSTIMLACCLLPLVSCQLDLVCLGILYCECSPYSYHTKNPSWHIWHWPAICTEVRRSSWRLWTSNTTSRKVSLTYETYWIFYVEIVLYTKNSIFMQITIQNKLWKWSMYWLLS